MAKVVARPKEAVTPIKQGKFEMMDVLFILGSAGVGYFTRFIVPSIVEIIYVLAYPVSFYLLLSPSDVIQKKNYQVAIQVLLKSRRTYHPIQAPKEDTHEI